MPAGDRVERAKDRSTLMVYHLESKRSRVGRAEGWHLASPSYTPDGASWIVNGAGQLWRVATDGTRSPEAIPNTLRTYIDIDHGISPDGRTIAFTSGTLFRLPGAGGTPGRIIESGGSYFHGWSPDGRTIVYAADRGQGSDVYAVAASGEGGERRLTTHPGVDDSAAFSPDGRWVYFNSDRAGNRDIWRLPADGDDSRAERLTADDREDWFPHPSPDGKWLIYQTWPAGTGGARPTTEVTIRRIALPEPGAKVDPKAIAESNEELVRFVGGHGSLGNSPWSPDSQRFVYASYDPPAPTARIVFISPSDLAPPEGVADRLDAIARAAEHFLLAEMKARGYPAAVDRIFERGPDGKAAVIVVRGASPVADRRYQDPVWVRAEASRLAREQAGIIGEGHVFWVFNYVGPPPGFFKVWQGHGDPIGGGSAVVNYDSSPGAIDPAGSLETGFNGTFFLKGCIHEFGHSLSLPHTGPDLTLGLGNSLMGANNDIYVARRLPDPDRVYLAAASAAMLWKHPLLSGTTADRYHVPEDVKLTAYKPTFSRTEDRTTIRGRVAARPLPHSVIVRDDLGRPNDHYWHITYAARVEPDGDFEVTIPRPTRAEGHYHLLFAFPNGVTTADDERHEMLGYWGLAKSYRFRDGSFRFGD